MKTQSMTVELLSTPFFKVVQAGKYYRIDERARENGVVIAAQRANGDFLLAWTFRPAINGYSYEFPRGAIDEGEDAMDAARRELREETGYVCTNLTLLGRMHSNTSLISSHVAITHAEVVPESQGESDGELESMAWVSMEKLDDMIRRGTITDSHTLSALMLLRCQAS